MRVCSRASPGPSNRHRSTPVAFSENSAKFTPLPSQVAPSGTGWAGPTRPPAREEARVAAGRVLGEQREVHAAPVPGRAEREGLAGPDAHHAPAGLTVSRAASAPRGIPAQSGRLRSSYRTSYTSFSNSKRASRASAPSGVGGRYGAAAPGAPD